MCDIDDIVFFLVFCSLMINVTKNLYFCVNWSVFLNVVRMCDRNKGFHWLGSVVPLAIFISHPFALLSKWSQKLCLINILV